jgi:hypothetical protein
MNERTEDGQRSLLWLSIGAVVVMLTLSVGTIGGKCGCKRAETTFSRVTRTIGAKESHPEEPSPAESAEGFVVREDQHRQPGISESGLWSNE